jgi:hypothetical protein
MDFRWIPGQSVDSVAIKRMKRHFPRPSEAPPVAWFMSDIQEYHSELLAVPIDQLSTSDLREYLFDTSSGLKNFFRLEEWVNWYHYLLPFALNQISEDDIFELILIYFINLYPQKITEEYSGFREDVIRTLPQAIMSPEFWKDNDLFTGHDWFQLYPSGNPKRAWTNAFYVSMFFCLKYLTPEEIINWIASASEIKGDLWNYHLGLWIAGAQELINYLDNPSTIPQNTISKDSISTEGLEAYLRAAEINWESSHLNFLRTGSKHHKPIEVTDYFPRENVNAFLVAVKQYGLD